MDEQRLAAEICARLAAVKSQGFEAVLVGGLTNSMVYAWCIAQKLGLDVVTARFKLKAGGGGRRKVLVGVQKMLAAGDVEVIAWEGRAEPKAPGRSARWPGSSAAGASPSPARPAANSPGMCSPISWAGER